MGAFKAGAEGSGAGHAGPQWPPLRVPAPLLSRAGGSPWVPPRSEHCSPGVALGELWQKGFGGGAAGARRLLINQVWLLWAPSEQHWLLWAPSEQHRAPCSPAWQLYLSNISVSCGEGFRSWQVTCKRTRTNGMVQALPLSASPETGLWENTLFQAPLCSGAR